MPALKTRSPRFGLYFSAAIDGKTIIRRRASRSWVKAFTWQLAGQWFNANQTIPDTSNVGRSTGTQSQNTNNGIDSSTFGIVVGTGTTAVATTDYKLATQIATGSSSGQLRYLGTTTNGPFNSSGSNSFAIIRSFINNSGADITVNEIGVYGSMNGFFFCLIRDVLGTGITVSNGQTLTLTYTISTGL